MFEFDQHFRETEYAWLQYLDDNGYLVPSPTYCTCPTPAAPEYADMRVYVCSVCSGLVILDSDEVSK